MFFNISHVTKSQWIEINSERGFLILKYARYFISKNVSSKLKCSPEKTFTPFVKCANLVSKQPKETHLEPCCLYSASLCRLVTTFQLVFPPSNLAGDQWLTQDDIFEAMQLSHELSNANVSWHSNRSRTQCVQDQLCNVLQYHQVRFRKCPKTVAKSRLMGLTCNAIIVFIYWFVLPIC